MGRFFFYFPQVAAIQICYTKGKWQQKFLLSHLKETPKQYIELYYRIFISALFHEIF